VGVRAAATGARWVLPPAPRAEAEALARALDLHPLAALLLARRGLLDTDAARRFLRPDVTHLHEPDLLPGVEAGAERLARAVRDREPVAVYGDYDVDGICGTALLVGLLGAAGGVVRPYLPDRRTEGYGFHEDAIRRLAADGVKVICTVDHGSRAFEEIALARSLGVDVVVTDHHLPGDGPIPDAVAIVNPRSASAGAPYPFPWLCGTGVAFKLGWAVARRLSGGPRVSEPLRRRLTESLALVALATVADVVPLVDENRVAVVYGLALLRRSPSPGIAALLETARLGDRDPTVEDVAFRLAPRINAAGRLGDAGRALELLTTADPERARALARELEAENRARKTIEKGVLAEARTRVRLGPDGAAPPAVVVAGDDWHPGVVGIVAARLAEEFHRPAVVVALEGESGRGSARTVNGFHLERALAACSEHLDAHGGHAAAAGLEVRRDRFEAFAAAFEAHAEAHLPAADRRERVLLDAVVPLAHLDGGLLRTLARLGPHGQGNPAPLLASGDLRVAGAPRAMGKDGDHVAFHAKDASGGVHRAVWFGGAARLAEVLAADGGRFSLAYAPEPDLWRGGDAVQLVVRDARPGAEAVDGDGA
jgi:single-stranded-DNA-specific exonuclease